MVHSSQKNNLAGDYLVVDSLFQNIHVQLILLQRNSVVVVVVWIVVLVVAVGTKKWYTHKDATMVS